MHSMIPIFAYMAPQPSLPLASIFAVLIGLVLMFCRYALALVTRRAQPATVRKTRGQRSMEPHSDPAAVYRT